MNTQRGESISIWFFIGISLLVNGVLIVGAGIYEFLNPPPNPVVLFELHANIWWGAVMLLAGVMYCYFFAPGRERPSGH
jgi:FtsH-binding integral membrane protein